MVQQQWLIDEAVALEEQPVSRGATRESASISEPVNLAIQLQDIIIWDTKKWFGGAEMRLDALVVHGNVTGEQASIYTPKTFRFPGVKSGDRLPTGENGLLIFYGQALHFLDIFITVSRNRENSNDLATLLNEKLQSPEFQGATATLLGLTTIAAPQVATVTSALGAASILGDVAYQVLRKFTGDTVGLYHTYWLQNRDNFGIGRHPLNGHHNAEDLSFWYEIIKD